MASSTKSDSDESQAFLPDFCAAPTLFVVLLVAELVAIVLSIATLNASSDFLVTLSKLSLFMIWVALASSAVICLLRKHLEQLGPTRAFVTSYVVLLTLCVVLAEIAYRLADQFGPAPIITGSHQTFLLQTLGISAIVIALANGGAASSSRHSPESVRCRR